MSLSQLRASLFGLEVCTDPAREECFVIAHRNSEMAQFSDTMSMPARRERLHRHMNNEIGSIEIAAQSLVDFPNAPWDLRMQLARQTYDECRHVEGLFRRLKTLGGRKGEFPINNFEWLVTNTQDTLAARLALQNRTFEAGQMDLLGNLRKQWREAGDLETADLLETILADEVNHVRFANRWIKKLAREDGRLVLKIAMAIRFLATANATVNAAEEHKESPDGSYYSQMDVNVDDRRNAEFTDDEINEILRMSGMPSLSVVQAEES